MTGKSFIALSFAVFMASFTQVVAGGLADSWGLVVADGETVTILKSCTLKSVHVEPGGVLIIGNVELRIDNDRDGADLLVDGTLIDKAAHHEGIGFLSKSTVVGGTTVTSEATWALGKQGTFIKTANSRITPYKECYEGGMSKIPETATWIYRYDCGTDVSFLSVGVTYPNLVFESVCDGYTWAPKMGTSTFQGKSSGVKVLGDLTIGLRGTGFVELIDRNIFKTSINVEKDFFIGKGSGLIADSNAKMQVRGKVVVDGLLDFTDGVLEFAGSKNQEVQGKGIIKIGRLSVDKDKDKGQVELSCNLSAGVLDLKKGVLDTQSDTLFAKGLDVLSDDAFVQGTLAFALHTPGRYQLPVGAGKYQQLAVVDFQRAPTSGYLYGQFHPSQAEISSSLFCGDVPITHFLDNGYWTIWASSGYSYTYSVSLVAAGAKNAGKMGEQHAVFKRHLPGTWEDIGVHAAGIIEKPFVKAKRNGLTGFSDFTIGVANQVLPIVLSRFYCEKAAGSTVLAWETLSERNASHFDIEWSSNGVLFGKIGSLAGHNSPIGAQYSWIPSERGYYRLKMIDFDGAFEYSAVVSLLIGEGSPAWKRPAYSILGVPIPTDDDFSGSPRIKIDPVTRKKYMPVFK